MNTSSSHKLLVWVFQTGEPLHIDGEDVRPMRAMNLSNTLVDSNHKVVLWSSAFYHQQKRQRSYKEKSIKISDNLEIRLIPSTGYQRNIGFSRLVDHAILAFNLKRMLEREASTPDVAFIGYPPIETAAILAGWLVDRGIPSLLDVKDQWPSLFLEAFPAPLRSLGRVALHPYYYLAKRAMRHATGLSSMAQGFLDWALRFSAREQIECDRVFPLTSPLERVEPSKLDEARRWWDNRGISDDTRLRICFVGSHSPSFDFKPVKEAAIAAMEQLPCEFVICGDGGTSLELRTMMSGLPNVYFPGWVDRPKIVALAERCHAALAPYYNIENFTMNLPNKIIDALSLGLPVLTPLQGEVSTLISKYSIGMRYGTDTGMSLYDCIRLLFNDMNLLKGMSQNARALYEEKFSFELVYGDLVKHLEKLAVSRIGYNR